MKLRDILKPEAVLGDLKGRDKHAVLEEFAGSAGRFIEHVPGESILNILLNREKLGSTAVGHGVAIPHGKLAGLEQIVALFGRSPVGIDFQAHDQQPTRLFLVLLAPETAIGNYLHALARLSRLFKDERIRDRILKCDAKELYPILIAEDDKL